MYLNSMSVTWTARIQTFLTFCKLLAISIIIVPGMYQLFKGETPSSIKSSSTSFSSSPSSHGITSTSFILNPQLKTSISRTFSLSSSLLLFKNILRHHTEHTAAKLIWPPLSCKKKTKNKTCTVNKTLMPFRL